MTIVTASLNIHSQRDMYAATLHACILATSEGFRHLTIAEIIEPRRGMLDAFLARQVALFLLIDRFGWPKRRVVAEEGRKRGTVNHGFHVVEERLQSERFAAHYEAIARRAAELLDGAMGDAS